ncbi:MAG: sugar phosphate isomerase/epimerase [Armatimonadota bacterium]|nr:sugar phosphate isomerase/epimerase [Armatimonadota bacterium]MDR7405030.1 sugar phosphate isomerase/epimerase [Armatimonadota bacterium]
MKLAGHTMGTPEYSVPEALDFFARLGLEGAEVIWQENYRCGIDPAASEATLRDLRRHASQAGISIVAITPYEARFNDLDPAVWRASIDAYTRALHGAAVLGARWVRLYGGRFLPGDGKWDERWARLVDSLCELGARAQRLGVVICVENHFNTMADTAARTAALVRAVDHPHVRVLYDQANLGFIGAEAWEDALERLAGLIAYVHVKDFVFTDTSRPFTARDVSHVEQEARIVRSCVVGDGIVPWPAILAGLRRMGYDGVLSLEYERRWHPDDLPPATEGMMRSTQRLRQWLNR